MTITDYRPPTVVQTLEQVSCWNCGIVFAVPPRWAVKRREDGQIWWCPNGHQAVFGEGEAARLRRQLTEAQRSRDNAWKLEERERRAHAVTKGKLTRARRRVGHGVCPMPGCKRAPFLNLAAHMATVHPAEVTAADLEAGAHPTTPPPMLAVGYGTMRVIATYARGKRYRCQCGAEIGTAGGRAKQHARTCERARQPWPS